MNRFVKTILSTILLCGVTCVVSANETKVELFTTQSTGLNHCSNENSCTVYFIDTEERLLETVFPHLPSNEEEAYKQVMSVINSPKWADYEKRFKDAQMPILRAWELGVTKYPAIVINDKFVVYGTTNVDVALTDYENYLQETQ